jgi:hypothetical protein
MTSQLLPAKFSDLLASTDATHRKGKGCFTSFEEQTEEEEGGEVAKEEGEEESR